MTSSGSAWAKGRPLLLDGTRTSLGISYCIPTFRDACLRTWRRRRSAGARTASRKRVLRAEIAEVGVSELR